MGDFFSLKGEGVKTPIPTKQPISAKTSADYSKNSQEELGLAVTDLEEAIQLVGDSFLGDEFDLANQYTKTIIDNIMVEVDNINNLLNKLTNAVNEYNSNIVDEEGNKVYVPSVKYVGATLTNAINTSLSHHKLASNNDPAGGNNQSDIDEGSGGTSNPQEEVLPKQPNNQEVNDSGKEEIIEQPNQEPESEEAKKSPSQDPKTSNSTPKGNSGMNINFEYKEEELEEIVNSILVNKIDKDFTGETIIQYNGKYYQWSKLMEGFLKDTNLENYTKDISYIDGTFVCNLTNGNTLNFDNITSFLELKNKLLEHLL